MSRVLCIAAACCFVCLVVIGCGPGGPELGTVTGKVTLDGKPVTNGLVTFAPVAKGGASIGKTDANGQYELLFVDRKGALLGQHKVTVTTVQEAAAVTLMRSDSPEYMKQAASATTRAPIIRQRSWSRFRHATTRTRN